MASLQTLRNKGGVIVAIVIGIALLAFVMGDLVTSGSTLFGASQNNVGEIDGTSISNQQYANQINYLTEIEKISTGSEAMTDERSNSLRVQAWEQLIREYAFKPSVAKLGLSVSEAEMVQLVGGAYVSPIIAQIFANPQTGQFDAQYLRSFVANMDQDPSGRLAMFWAYLQSEVSDQSLLFKFKSLIDKAAYVTGFEAEQMAQIGGSNYVANFVAQRYDAISDSTITVSESEVKAFYEKSKNMFRQQNVRQIEYVVFEALPSQTDYAQADKYINELVSEFQASQNIQQFVSLNSQSPMDSRYYKEGEMTGELGDFAFKATTDQIYGPSLDGDQYTVARISDVKVIPDSVNFSHIVVLPSQKAQADSIVDVLKKGGKFAELAAAHSIDDQTKMKGGEVGTIDPQTLPEQFSKVLFDAKKGDVVTVTTPGSLHVIKVNDRKGDGRKVQLGVVKYTIEPSANTRNEAYGKSNSFASATGASGQSFADVAAEKSLSIRTATIGANDRNVQGLAQSRELARWAFNSKKGEVSKVMEFGDSFVVATLTTVRQEGVASYDEVKNQIATMVRMQKKGEMLAQKMSGASSLDELASKLSTSVINASEINFSTYVIPEIGFDPAFAGGIVGMNDSKLSKPIIGMAGVYVAKVDGKLENQISPELERARLNADVQQRAFEDAYQAFLKMSNIKDERYKFY